MSYILYVYVYIIVVNRCIYILYVILLVYLSLNAGESSRSTKRSIHFISPRQRMKLQEQQPCAPKGRPGPLVFTHVFAYLVIPLLSFIFLLYLKNIIQYIYIKHVKYISIHICILHISSSMSVCLIGEALRAFGSSRWLQRWQRGGKSCKSRR